MLDIDMLKIFMVFGGIQVSLFQNFGQDLLLPILFLSKFDFFLIISRVMLLELSLKLCHCFVLFCEFFSRIFDDEVLLLQTFIVFYWHLAVCLFD
jgi:hypothetical protein